MNFDPQAFMNATMTQALDTRVIPCPVGEYPAQITKLDVKSGEIKQGDRQGQTWAGLEVHCEIEDQGVKQIVGRDKVISRGLVMLDLTEEGMIDLAKGKNVRLGKLRDACGLNQPGQAFSPPMLVGQRLVVSIGHRADPKDPSILYDEVTGFRKL